MTSVRDMASVTITTGPVSGAVTRRQNGRRELASAVDVTRVDPLVWATIQARLRPGERAVIVSATEARTVYR